jgi:hypothetical protein
VRLVRNAVDHLRRQVGHIRQSPRRAPTRAPAAGREAFAGSEVHRLPVGLLLAQMEGLDGNAGTNPRRWTAWSSSRYRAVSRRSHAAGVQASGGAASGRTREESGRASLACRRPRPYETDPTDTRGPEGGRYFIYRPPRTVDEMPSIPSAVRLGRSSPPPTSNASSLSTRSSACRAPSGTRAGRLRAFSYGSRQVGGGRPPAGTRRASLVCFVGSKIPLMPRWDPEPTRLGMGAWGAAWSTPLPPSPP